MGVTPRRCDPRRFLGRCGQALQGTLFRGHLEDPSVSHGLQDEGFRVVHDNVFDNGNMEMRAPILAVWMVGVATLAGAFDLEV